MRASITRTMPLLPCQTPGNEQFIGNAPVTMLLPAVYRLPSSEAQYQKLIKFGNFFGGHQLRKRLIRMAQASSWRVAGEVPRTRIYFRIGSFAGISPALHCEENKLSPAYKRVEIAILPIHTRREHCCWICRGWLLRCRAGTASNVLL